ncbi:MAG: purine-nucleoside phosphorylase [Cellvibrionaceae bacterium]|nr:purine-nucleoside phosphorylase [Cellvibrionaceae bacterium]MCV6626214.1 purine-nucleoside phosphorylase [Cellvibrionaceae bacterium]
MSSIHINAPKDAFADTVIMPGDPLRAKFIAEHYLENAQLISDVRNMLAYTGHYKGQRLSVMGHGMGVPSATIYCTELAQTYGVKRMIRVGSCGAVHPDVQLRDIIIAQGASTDSNANKQRAQGFDVAALASYPLLEKAVSCAREQDAPYKVGAVFTSDLFYWPDSSVYDALARFNVLAIEMEVAAVYAVAAEFNIEALALCTVSDHIRTDSHLTTDERQESFEQMIEVALGVVES